MSQTLLAIQHCEEKVEDALRAYEQKEDLDNALAVYRAVETDLLALNLQPGEPHYPKQQATLAYALMRQANILRQQGQAEDAAVLSQREIAAAREAGDPLTLARSLMSLGITLIATGQVAEGMSYFAESGTLFAQEDGQEFRQGLGWHWIIRADLVNGRFIEADPADVITYASTALEILTPLENWPGIARAYAARAAAYEKLGNDQAAQADREQQQEAAQHIGT
jgi:tetratricopeptide (TPR) repeat protein